MKGCIIVNAHTHNSCLDYQPKRLKQEFEKLGHDVDIIENLVPVVLCEHDIKSHISKYEFCVYLDKDIPTLKAIEKIGIKVFNNSKAIYLCDDKALTYIELSGIVKMPKTIIGAKIYNDNEQVLEEYLDKIEKELYYPIVIKLNKSSQGLGVFIAKDRQQLISLINQHKTESIIFQEYIKGNFGEDIRIITVGDKVLGGMKRKSNSSDFRSNVALGGSAERIELNDKLIELSLNIVKKMNLSYSGIDFLENEKGEYVLCEVNSNAFFETFEKTLNVNVARIYAEYILSEIDR